jgi:general secretion pathway protein J
MAYAFLNSAMGAFDTHRAQAQRLDEINLFFTLISRDIGHVVDRPVRDEYGEQEPAVLGGSGQQYLLTLTRGGRLNPRYVQRSDLQRIAYLLEDDILYRAAWPMLDRGASDNSDEGGNFRAAVLHRVIAISVHFLRAEDVQNDDREVGKQWQDSWPLRDFGTGGISQQTQSKAPLPVAVEVRLELEDMGEFSRLFALPEQASNNPPLIATGNSSPPAGNN